MVADGAGRHGASTGLDAAIGRAYGPAAADLSRAGVAAFVRATSDDEDRWVEHAPPSYAGALLFSIAPSFLADPDVAPHATMVIHGEQTFEWYRPFAVGSALEVWGRLEKVRERGGVSFASFGMSIADPDGVVVTARSTFLMSGDAPPGGDVEERSEPPPDERGEVEIPQVAIGATGELAPLAKSASRSDLVRYAAASGDFNPIHWDHGLAAAAGLGGVVAHGLLAAAWSTQAASRVVQGPRPLVRARIRFRNPLYPAAQATVLASRDGATLTATVRSGEVDHVVAQMELAEHERNGEG